MESFKGMPVSKGITIGRISRYSKEKIITEVHKIKETEIQVEIKRFNEAKKKANEYLANVKEKARQELGSKELQIFDAHFYMLNDPVLDEEIRNIIRKEHINVEAAIRKAISCVAEKFRGVGNGYIQERVRDIQDVGNHLLRALSGKMASLQSLSREAIVLAEDLTPSETALLDKKNLKGFIFSKGGETAHTSIMAKSLMIPAVIQVEGILEKVKQGDLVILDALRGEVIVNPNEEVLIKYKEQINGYKQKQLNLLKLKDKKAETRDGFVVDVAANIASIEEMELARSINSDGIGLFRTEFIFLKESHLTDEERQYRIYKEVLEDMKPGQVVVRTLDIGGDKDLPYFFVPEEVNPFLGWRGIRISLERLDIFKCQLRALLRSSIYGNLKILFPLISSMEELRRVKRIFKEIKDDFKNRGIPYNENVEIGIMIEVPSTAILAEQFAKEVDFFSIGTNDLIQYTLAVDRTNSKIADLYNPYHPAVLRLIYQVVEASHSKGIWVGVCGETASDPLLVPLFVGMGITELSMSSGSVLEVKEIIQKMEREAANNLVEEVMKFETAEEVREFLESNLIIRGGDKLAQ